MAKRKNTNRKNTSTADANTADTGTAAADTGTAEVSTVATVGPADNNKVSAVGIAAVGTPVPEASGTANTVGMNAADPQDTSPDAADDCTGAQILSWFLPRRLYQMFKWLTLTVLPALAVLVGSIGPVWSLPHSHAIVTTISAVSLFLGSIIGVSEIKARILSPPDTNT